MTLIEIVQMARKIRDTLRDGFKRAAHYLRSLGLDLKMARWALLGA